jgi:ketosteroid isomerase-like protein
MTASSAQIVEDAFGAFNTEGTEALLPYVHPEAEFSTPPELSSEPDTYRGHEGVRRYFDSFFDAMDEIRIEPVELHERGDRVVVEFVLRARGKSTGIEAEQRAFAVVEMREGMIFSISIHATREAAEDDAAGASGSEPSP